jgi:hypothetical protein
MALKLSKTQAREFSKRLDFMANIIQQHWRKMHLAADEEAAKKIAFDFCMACDQVSDAIEISAIESEKQAATQQKQAQVLQSESDEPYMAAFENVNNPISTQADEPYMASFDTDVSSDVRERKEQAPAGLNPWASPPKTSESAGGGAAPSTYPPGQFK